MTEITRDKYPLGRSCLGLHWTPVMGHDVADLRSYMDRAKEANVGWIALIDDGGGSVLQPSNFYGGRSVVDEMLEREFQLLVRMYCSPWAKADSRIIDTCGRLVEKGVHYVCMVNEPECEDWPKRPKNWVEVVMRNWVDGAYKMKEVGAYPGTPAFTTFKTPNENGNVVNQFLAYMTEAERNDLFINWYAWICRHIYLIHHPVDYPYDAVNQVAEELTHEQYLSAIEEVSPTWRAESGKPWVWEDWEISEHHINSLRREGVQPGSTIYDDDVCWLSYLGTKEQAREAGIADHTIILCKEGGTAIGDKGKDGRYPRRTAAAQIRAWDTILKETRDDDMLKCVCAWIAGVRELSAVTADSFERQGWWTHEWDGVFELDGEIPLVQYLVDNPDLARYRSKQMSKLGPHAQIGDQGVLDLIAATKPPVMKTMNLSWGWCRQMKEASPDSILVARAYVDNQERYKTDPGGLVQEMLELYNDGIGYIDVIEVTNEAVNNNSSAEDIAAFDTFQAMFAEHAWLIWPDIKVGLFCLPTGNFGYPGEWKLTDFPKTLALPRDKVYFCFHEYSWYTWDWESPARCLRYRTQMDGIEGKVIITECGLTQAVLDKHPDIGWRSGVDEATFVDGMHWYDMELQKDDYVVGATVFNCGPSHDWDTFEATKQVLAAAQMTTEPTEPEPEPPPVVEPEVVNDAEAYGVTILPADAEPGDIQPGDKYWKVIEVHHLTPEENNGQHHVFLDVLDENGNRLYGAHVEGWWGTGGEGEYVVAVVDKPLSEPGTNIVLHNIRQVTNVACIHGGYDSDIVRDMHTNHPNEGPVTEWGYDGNAVGHHSFKVVFQLTEKEAEEPTEPEPEETRNEVIRRKAWDGLYPHGIERNPTAAFQKYAANKGWFCPVTKEFRVTYDTTTYAGQGFVNKIIACVEGDWGNIFEIDWNA